MLCCCGKTHYTFTRVGAFEYSISPAWKSTSFRRDRNGIVYDNTVVYTNKGKSNLFSLILKG